ncbi:hypothetical protein GCM10012287_31520 [Streptomyces daqingensis]|uniref:Uncharacterized protein n=1 Tax=Streptomyces daqingensis TaxID=1472640 RepID=A0ABQ2MIS0_9ACTN|nr:hypothetical protein GCM10012287_31520 [Streptomyces daqingensis]
MADRDTFILPCGPCLRISPRAPFRPSLAGYCPPGPSSLGMTLSLTAASGAAAQVAEGEFQCPDGDFPSFPEHAKGSPGGPEMGGAVLTARQLPIK